MLACEVLNRTSRAYFATSGFDPTWDVKLRWPIFRQLRLPKCSCGGIGGDDLVWRALLRRSSYSSAVGSWPPICTSIAISSIFPGCGASPGSITISTINTRPAGFPALRTCWRDIVRHWIFVPVVEDVRKNISVRPGGNAFVIFTGLNCDPIAHTSCVKRRPFASHAVCRTICRAARNDWRGPVARHSPSPRQRQQRS